MTNKQCDYKHILHLPGTLGRPDVGGKEPPIESRLDPSDSGTDITTPLLVPIHSRPELISNAVMRTREKPNFPVPNILLTYGSMSTSFKCWYVCAWYKRNVESIFIDTC